jgi:adenine phosphoribosyltransferase
MLAAVTIADELLDRFRWVDGHADVWRLFADPPFFAALVKGLSGPFTSEGITKVAGIESRGFILGAATAVELHAGFVAVRKESGLLPGDKLKRVTPPDYRGDSTTLRVQKEGLGPGDRVLLVDDWAETGSQALTAKALVESSGAEFVGMSVIVDQLETERRLQLGRFAALVQRDALGPDV